MAVTTRDAAKIGQTTYRGSVSKWNADNSDHTHLWAGEFPNLSEAEITVRSQMQELSADTGMIYEGTWVASNFHDDEYGIVRDAMWDEHDVTWYFYPTDHGIEMEEDRW